MSMNYLDQFQKHLANHDYPAFLILWEEYCLGDEVDIEELKQILKSVKGSPLALPFGRHVDKGLMLWEKIQSTELGHEIFKLIIDLQTTNELELCEQTLDYLKAQYPEDPYYQDKIRLVGLRERKNFQHAVSNYELLTHMKKGSFVFHTAGWGVGEIMEVSFLCEQLTLEFDYVSGPKDLSFQNAFKTLIPLKDDHFLALRFGQPDELENRAKKNPIDIIHLLLKDLGPLTAADIKEELYELVIQKNDWIRWWQSVRSKIKKDTMIETPSDIRKPFRLRKSEVSHEEVFQKALEKKPNAETFIQLVYAFLRDFPATLKNDTFRMDLEQKLKEALATEELSDAQELQIYFFLQDLTTTKKKIEQVTELIKRFISPDEVVKNMEVIAFKKRTLIEIYKSREDWPHIFLNLLLGIDQSPLRDYILNALLKGKKNAEVIKKLEELLSFPTRYPHVVMWYFQKIMKDDTLPLSNQEGKNRFFEAFLILLSSLEQLAGYRDLIKKMYNFLITSRYVNVRKIFQKADIETVKEFLLLATKCHSLSDHDIKIFHSLAEVVHPSLEKNRKKYQDDLEETPPIWTTESGYHKIKKRIHTISTIETVKNAKEIEIARSYGDLRENAEFKAALEKRDRLQSELKLLVNDFNQARIITKADIHTDKVNVGMIIDCKGEDGSQISYTLLGPWDADPDNHILSFQSKLAQSMIGKKIGDKINIQGKHFTIANLRNYFDTV